MSSLDIFWFVIGIVLTALFFIWKSRRWFMTQKQRLILMEKELHSAVEKRKQSLEQEHEACLTSLKASLTRAEINLKIKAEQYEQQKQQLDRKVSQTLSALSTKELSIAKEREKIKKCLEEIHKLSFEEIIQLLEPKMIDQARERTTAHVKHLETIAEKKGQALLLQAVEKASLTNTKESFTHLIQLPDPAIAPRLIGKEGKIITRLEELCGVNLRIDSSPSQIVIASLNGRRRALACVVIEQLMKYERISLALVESSYRTAVDTFDNRCIENGRLAAGALASKMSKNMLKMIGEMEFYSSLGQNLLQHSIEVAKLASRMAMDMNLKRDDAFLMGLLHDIGKVLPETAETHAQQGQAFCIAEGISREIANGVGAHHNEIAPLTDEARLIPIADQISAGLMGNRK